jgi:hypothetical protein
MIEQKVQALINGETVTVPDNLVKDVQTRLREIKKNATLVLSQLKEWR